MAQATPTPAATPDATDTVVALYPYDLTSGSRSGEHPGKTFSATGKTSYRSGCFFQAEDISFSDIDGLHAHLERLAAEGRAFVVRGQRAHGMAFLRRTLTKKGKTPAGLIGAPLRVLALDLDDVPNIDSLDPRTDPVGAWSWLRSLVGPEFAAVRCSAAWSSSCCVGVPAGQAPEHLDARLWVMLDEPVSAQGARDLLKGLSARVTATLEARGASLARISPKTGKSRRYNPVDPKIADTQQPIYVAAPRFLDGLCDPLTVRTGLLHGSRDTVSLSDLRAGMRAAEPSAPVAANDDVAAADRPAKTKAIRKPRGRVRIPGKVVPLAASARLIAAQRALLEEALQGRGTESYRAACTHLYHRRVALEMVALAVHRGGLPEGERDESCTRIASALVASLPLGWPMDRVRGDVRQLLLLVTDPEWLETEWERAGADASVLDRYRRASNDEKGPHGRDLRYSYGKARLVEEWMPTFDEVLALGLRSLCTEADAKAADRDEKRAEAGTLDREDWLAAARAEAPRVHALRAEGRSLRAIADETGLTLSKVRRLLALAPDEVAAVQAVPSMAVEAPVVVGAAPAEVDVLEGAIRYVMASTGADTAQEVAAALLEPVGLVEFVMREMGLLPGVAVDVEFRRAA